MAYEALTCDDAGIGLETMIRGAMVKNDDGSFAMKTYPGYLSYVAAISQSGTDDPTAEVNYNTLSGTPVWSRAAEGSYSATLVGAFPAGKTRCFINGGSINGDDLSIVVIMERVSDDVCSVSIRLASDGTTSADLVGGPSISLEIRVYP